MIKNYLKIGLLTLLFSGTGLTMYGQIGAERKADKGYEHLAFMDAVSIYEKIAAKGYKNASLLEKLGDSYYFNGKLTDAYKWYNELFNGEYEDKGRKPISSEHYYRYAQTLKAMEDYAASDKVMEEFVRMEEEDSRAQMFERNKDYISKIKDFEERYTLHDLGINSPYSDYGGTLLKNQFIFTSARETEKASKSEIHEWTNESYTSLFSSKIDLEGNFGAPVWFAKELNSKVNDASAVFTKDGKTMYFTRNNATESGRRKENKERSSLLKIYKATLGEDGKWGDLVEMPFNSDNWNTAHPALSPDDKYLYFASDMEGTKGQSDIFRVAIYEGGNYSRPENLLDKINTSGRETFPFVSKDNFLFFASDGHPGLGGLDVFVAKINADNSIERPRNMGTPINSPYDDFGFYLDSNAKKGFVSSNRPGGKGGDDIYFFKEKPCTQALEGIVYDKNTQEVLPGSLVIISDALYTRVDSLTADDKGYYKTNYFDCGQKYRIKAERAEYTTVEIAFTADYQFGVKTANIGLERAVEPIKVNDDLFKKLNLNPIYFDFDKDNIRPDAAIELMKIVEVMKAYPKMKIDVRSHTDSRGKDAYNLKLSDRRAKSTVNWIIGQGIEADRIKGQGYGETRLLNNCSNGVKCSEAEHQLNRRSEFIVEEI